jgi:hypothetical protein
VREHSPLSSPMKSSIIKIMPSVNQPIKLRLAHRRVTSKDEDERRNEASVRLSSRVNRSENDARDNSDSDEEYQRRKLLQQTVIWLYFMLISCHNPCLEMDFSKITFRAPISTRMHRWLSISEKWCTVRRLLVETVTSWPPLGHLDSMQYRSNWTMMMKVCAVVYLSVTKLSCRRWNRCSNRKQSQRWLCVGCIWVADEW